MTSHITSEEAERLKPPNYNSYKYSHLLYHDELHRNYGVYCLNQQALMALSDTVVISQSHIIGREDAEIYKWFELGGNNSGTPYPSKRSDESLKRLIFSNYENLKIASAFELHLKSRLLSDNYIIHEISEGTDYKVLAKKQRKEPVKKSELIEIQSYHFDGTKNYLPGLKDSSINFSWITDKPAYRAVLGLTDQQLNIIKDFRILRNQIHFPGDPVESPHIQTYPRPIIEFLLQFGNSEIVDWQNKLITKYGMQNFAPLKSFN